MTDPTEANMERARDLEAKHVGRACPYDIEALVRAIASAIDAAEARGREIERADVVAWLLGEHPDRNLGNIHAECDARLIASGAHVGAAEEETDG